jgi:hypothetical protein
MNIKDSMKLAAAVVGTTITGRPPIQVSRKVLPIRANYPRAEGLMFTTRFIFDGAGRRIEELHILSGRMPPGTTRFYFAGQIEFTLGDKTLTVKFPNNGTVELKQGTVSRFIESPREWLIQPAPIMARNAIEAFREYDNVLNALAAELQKKLDEAEAEALKAAEDSAKAEALKNASKSVPESSVKV